MEKLFELLPYEMIEEIFNHYKKMHQEDICKCCYLKKDCNTDIKYDPEYGCLIVCSDCHKQYYYYEGELINIEDNECYYQDEFDLPSYKCSECGCINYYF